MSNYPGYERGFAQPKSYKDGEQIDAMLILNGLRLAWAIVRKREHDNTAHDSDCQCVECCLIQTAIEYDHEVDRAEERLRTALAANRAKE